MEKILQKFKQRTKQIEKLNKTMDNSFTRGLHCGWIESTNLLEKELKNKKS